MTDHALPWAPHFLTEFDKEARSRIRTDPFYHDAARLVEEYRVALNIITQQAQELAESERRLREVCLAHGPALIEIHDLKKELAAARARCREMETERDAAETERIEWVRRAERAEARAEELQATLAAAQSRIVDLETDVRSYREDWQLEYTLHRQTKATLAEREARMNKLKAEIEESVGIYKARLDQRTAERDAAVQEAWRLKEALGNLTCEVCKMDVQRAMDTQHASGGSGGSADRHGVQP